MNNKKHIFFSAILGIALSLVILITSINYYTFNDQYYKVKFNENEITKATGMEESELHRVIERITGYLSGRYDDLNLMVDIKGEQMLMFNDKEISHMVDVRKIFDDLSILRYILIAVLVLGTGFLYRKKRGNAHFYRIMTANGIFTVFVFLMLLIMVTTDFTKYFIKFHQMFFSNDLWILDPATDRLIQMLPESFFSDITVSIVSAYGIISVIIGVIGIYLLKKDKE